MTDIDPRLSRLYRETSTEDPPAVLDAAILAAARTQVRRPQRRERASWASWIAPAGVMATLVLGVSVALLIEREHPETTGGTTGEATIHPIAPPPARLTESAKEKAADSAVPAVAAEKPAQAPVPRAAVPADSTADGIPAEGRARATAPRAMKEPDVARDATIAGQRARAAAAPAAAAGESGRMDQQAIQRSPEAWLEAIGRLRREGREAEAAEQLVEFRKAYPAYPIPEIPSR